MDSDRINEILFDAKIGFFYFDLCNDKIEIQLPSKIEPHQTQTLVFNYEKMLNFIHPEDKFEVQMDLIAIQKKERKLIDQRYRIKNPKEEYFIIH